MIRYTTLCGALCFAAQLTAADGLSGSWKFDPTKSQGAGWAQYEKQGDFIVWSNQAGTMAKFKTDGKEHPTENGKGTISFKRIDKNTLESTSKAGGAVLSNSTMTFTLRHSREMTHPCSPKVAHQRNLPLSVSRCAGTRRCRADENASYAPE